MSSLLVSLVYFAVILPIIVCLKWEITKLKIFLIPTIYTFIKSFFQSQNKISILKDILKEAVIPVIGFILLYIILEKILLIIYYKKMHNFIALSFFIIVVILILALTYKGLKWLIYKINDYTYKTSDISDNMKQEQLNENLNNINKDKEIKTTIIFIAITLFCIFSVILFLTKMNDTNDLISLIFYAICAYIGIAYLLRIILERIFNSPEKNKKEK